MDGDLDQPAGHRPIPIHGLTDFDPNVPANGLLIVLPPLQRTVQTGRRHLQTIGVGNRVGNVKRSAERMMQLLAILNSNPSVFIHNHPNDYSVAFALTLDFDDFKLKGLGNRLGDMMDLTPRPAHVHTSTTQPHRAFGGTATQKKVGFRPLHYPLSVSSLHWKSKTVDSLREGDGDGEPPRARTEDPRLKRAMLCQLS